MLTTKRVVLLLAVAVAGCDRIIIEDSSGSLRLTYHCSAYEPVVRTRAEYDLVRGYAVRLTKSAMLNGNLPSVRSLMDADYEGREADVERLVVEALCADAPVAPREEARPPVFPEPGSVVGDFTLRLLEPDGESSQVSLGDLRGSYALLNFWSTWCGPCVEKHPEVVALSKALDGRLRVLGVLHRDRPELARAYLKEHGSYPVLLDSDGELARQFLVRGIPRMFLIDPSGVVVSQSVGGGYGSWREDFLRIQVDSLMGDWSSRTGL